MSMMLTLIKRNGKSYYFMSRQAANMAIDEGGWENSYSKTQYAVMVVDEERDVIVKCRFPIQTMLEWIASYGVDEYI